MGRRRLGHAFLALLLSASFLSGCLGGSPADPAAPADDTPAPTEAPGATAEGAAPSAALTEPVVVLEDPKGDATEHNSNEAYAAWSQACSLVAREQRTCREAVPSDPRGGMPAAPSLDVVSLAAQDSPTELVFRVGLASLSNDVQQFVDASGEWGAMILIEYAAGTSCVGRVVYVVRVIPDAVYAAATHSRKNDACEPQPGDPLRGRCATVNDCSLPIDWTVEPGTPGMITMRVPRAQTALVEAGAEVRAVLSVQRVGSNAFPGGQIQPGGDLGTNQFSPDSRIRTYAVDRTDEGRFTLATTGDPDAWGRTATVTAHGPVVGGVKRGELDIVSVALADDARNFTVTTTLRALPEVPERYNLHWQFTTPGKHHYVVDAWVDGGAWRVEAFRWAAERQIPIHAGVTVTPGSPGTIAITFPRSDLPGTNAGGLTRAFYGVAQEVIGVEDTDGPTGFYYADVQPANGPNIVLPPYRFMTDPAEATALPALEITDAIGDVAGPPDANVDPAFRESRFDISYAAVRADASDRIRVDLGVTGLDSFVVPRLHDAVLYGVGFQTATGSWMIALLQDKTSDAPSALCGPDVALLTPDPRAPTAAGGVPVTWSLVPASGDAAGLLTFEVPTACLGLAPGAPDMPITRFVARTAVMGSGAGEAGALTVLDEAEVTEGGRLVFPQSALIRSPWAEPFGIQNFWDIVGVGLAALIALITAGTVVLKRMRMKRYLVRLEELADLYHDDPKRYAEALVALRMGLFEDLLRNRVTEGHFVMVEERVRGYLSSTRINAFGRAFYQLPPALMLRLQSLLSDGRFSTQDHRAITQLLDELHIAPEDRSGVRAQIDLWAVQDQAVARLGRLARRRRGWRRMLPRRAIREGSG